MGTATHGCPRPPKPMAVGGQGNRPHPDFLITRVRPPSRPTNMRAVGEGATVFSFYLITGGGNWSSDRLSGSVSSARPAEQAEAGLLPSAGLSQFPRGRRQRIRCDAYAGLHVESQAHRLRTGL